MDSKEVFELGDQFTKGGFKWFMAFWAKLIILIKTKKFGVIMKSIGFAMDEIIKADV